MLTEIFKNIFIEGLYNLEGTQRVVADIIAIMLFFLFWACATCGYKLFKLLEAVPVQDTAPVSEAAGDGTESSML